MGPGLARDGPLLPPQAVQESLMFLKPAQDNKGEHVLRIITPPSGRGLVISIFFPWFFFFGGHLPQTSGFRSAKQILVVSFATQARAFILSDRNIVYNPPGGRTTAGSNAPGAFLVDFIDKLDEHTISEVGSTRPLVSFSSKKPKLE